MPHGSSRGVHGLLSILRVNHPHPNNSPQEPLMRISWFYSPESLQLFVVEEGLHPKVVIHPQGFELLGKRKVCEDHVMDLNCKKSVFHQKEPKFDTTTRFP